MRDPTHPLNTQTIRFNKELIGDNLSEYYYDIPGVFILPAGIWTLTVECSITNGYPTGKKYGSISLYIGDEERRSRVFDDRDKDKVVFDVAAWSDGAVPISFHVRSEKPLVIGDVGIHGYEVPEEKFA